VEEQCGLPVVSAATCTVFHALETLGLKTVAPNAGRLLSGRYGRPASPVPPKSATEPLPVCAAPPTK
jgi:maleate isomerase